MMKRPLIFILFSALISFQFLIKEDLKFLTGYWLSSPDASYVLPPELHEISGLTEIDSVSFACVQDELGTIFIYDAVKNKIRNQFTFAMPGDYEGITRVGKNLYVLRSDGALAEVLNFESPKRHINYYYSYIPVRNNEGLCYDATGNRLLIGGKSRPEGEGNRDRRLIYAFDLKTKTIGRTPAFEFDTRQLTAYAINNNVPLPYRTRKKGKTEVRVPVFKLNTSEIAIHPVTKQLFLLSAADKMLLLFDLKGNIQHMEVLDPALFNKPEGITFFMNGDMLITNEGQESLPTLHRFKYHR